VLKLLLDNDAEPIGDPKQAHMVPIDARSPKFDGGIATRLDCITLGVVLNKNGERFYDEGEDFWPMRYAIWGHIVAKQVDQVAYVFIDSKTYDHFMPSVFPPIKGNTIAAVAEQFHLPLKRLKQPSPNLIDRCNRSI
jgi:tricarballylate dehydrogenase